MKKWRILYAILIFIGSFLLGFWGIKLYSNNLQILKYNKYIINQLESTIKNKDFIIAERDMEIKTLLDKIHQKDRTIFDYIKSDNPNLTSKEIAEIANEIFQTCQEYRIDPNQYFAICDVESDYNKNFVGTCQERGLPQVSPWLFKKYKKILHLNDIDFSNWRITLKISMMHYRYLLDRHKNNLELVWAEYNAGLKYKYGMRYAQKVRVAYERIKKLEE